MATTLSAQHDKIKKFDWEPSYFRGDARYPTRYKIPPRTKDPFRTLVREYVGMEEEKDDRQYGALEDALGRMNNSAHAEPRFMEALKPVISIVDFGEYAAMKATAMLVDTVENPELRQGYLAQMIDEVRHVNQEAYLMRYLAKHAPDPAGFNSAFQMRAHDPIGRAGRAALEGFMNNDPIANAINLQVVAETAYTNPLFVALTEVAAANGDQATPSVFLSVQSDEARHMANGYSTLAAVLAEPDNLPMLQEDFDTAFWRNHIFLDSFQGAVYDYFSKVRTKSYKEYWQQWIWEDWAGSYIEQLAPFGLQVPRWIDDARRNVNWTGHSSAMASAALWPIHAWRSDYMDDDDFAYLEDKYPGWEEHFGGFWRAYRDMAHPGQGHLALELFPALPPICNTCQMPAVFPRPDINEVRFFVSSQGRRLAFCSDGCEHIYRQSPQRFNGLTWYELNHGVELWRYIETKGLLRSDGKTLMGQPHVHTDEEWLWTIDDIKRMDVVIADPLQAMPAEQFGAL
ncbi:monooxygenase [Mycobacterium avium]|uniref:propane 2-monooxygenase n=1 Tax=Mycobacterium avium TaxID=1764 RepID=A0A2A2ZNS0_MYCAV|nr:aromatic/alkene/methane monooxygenase hydroxylase/oxygenase subunit alpha [Mycobacterium avium]ETZ44711.1 YHS domain protein [Mycobacterium avium MAV_120709_2344]MCA4735810.1 monooxygenase [Mycobacterium avium subsp. hominissuis]MCA4740459.1 monooxygenase [Mycobacterium avium subsp. hominissuis]MCA4744709.1 monooxygenase [Mycobacterium avium subsp. hominissuis]MCA4764280.1 monooxygenase [Mycobacterium avium subsp. hominissuis]